MFYVKLVKQFLTQRGGDALGSDVQNRIAEIARNSGSYGIPATGGLCETWVEAVYRKAGVSINNFCCAGKNGSLYTVSKYSANIPIGAMVYLLFCTTKFGWGFDNYFEECNTGKGLKLSRVLKPYLKYALPVLIVIVFVQGFIG